MFTGVFELPRVCQIISFSCKDSLLWQGECLTGDYTVPPPCIARHEELITVLMLRGSVRLWLMGSCAGAAHLKARRGRLAPLAPLALLGSRGMCFLNGSRDRSLPHPSLTLQQHMQTLDCSSGICRYFVLHADAFPVAIMHLSLGSEEESEGQHLR